MVPGPDSGMALAVQAPRSFFSLEMTPEGVSLRLDQAVSRIQNGTLGISGLVLSVPWIEYPFDYTAGPKSLRNSLTILKSVRIEVGFDMFAAIAGTVLDEVAVERADSATMVISGGRDDAPCSVRAEFSRADGGLVEMILSSPRIFSLGETSWESVAIETARSFDSGSIGRACRLALVRDALKPLMSGLGFKLPLMDSLVLSGYRVLDDRVQFSFVEDTSVSVGNRSSSSSSASVHSMEPSEILKVMSESGMTPADVVSFIESAIAFPVLWPEVMARAIGLGGDHPECVPALLAVILTGYENPGWIDDQTFLVYCRRLLAAAEMEGSRSEYARCAVLVSRVIDRFPAAVALDLLNGIRSAGLENREILEAVALTFDRLGRPLDASTSRLRSLALVPGRMVPDVVRSMVDRMEVNGFGDSAASWLKDLADLASRERFGGASTAVHRTSMLLLAARDAIHGRPAAWGALREMLVSSPADPEILETMLNVAREKHQVAEAIELFKAAADGVSGARRCELLLIAAKALKDKFGLRRRCAELLVRAVDADPACIEAGDMLDGIWASLGRSADRVGLARIRLAHAVEPARRRMLLQVLMESAEDSGQMQVAAEAVRELLRMDPSDAAFLLAGERIFAAAADVAGLAMVLEALEDLGLRKPDLPAVDMSVIERAVAAGDLDAAIHHIRTMAESMVDTDGMKELLLQGADLSVLAGRWNEASSFLVSAAALDVRAAMKCAVDSILAVQDDPPPALVDVLRSVSMRPSTAAERRDLVALLQRGAETAYELRPSLAVLFLEVALFMDPDDLSSVMALSAACEVEGGRVAGPRV